MLLALSDANNRFIYADIGAYGRSSDGGIYANSSLKKAMDRGQLDIPSDNTLANGNDLGPMPYVMVGDEAFPLTKHIMRPYGGNNLDRDKQIFNYRLSRARIMVEGAFGLLVARWRVLESRLQIPPATAISVVKACCILHNIILMCDNIAQNEVCPRRDTANIERSEENDA